MVDTIKLTLDKTMFYIAEKDRFQRDKLNSIRGYFTMVQNSTKTELQQGIYKPRLTYTHRYNCSGRAEDTLSVELSLPKLLFLNNFDELQDSDFEQVTQLLQIRLREMGVRVFTNILTDAPVSLIHYSKNNPLTDGSTPHYLISKLKEANMPLSLDVNQTDYQNDGQSYKWHANSYEIAFYDKIYDLKKAKRYGDKRTIEKGNGIQLNLFDTFEKRRKFEVLRFEVRLNSRQKMSKLFRELGVNTELTFHNLFSSAISQNVLLHYLDKIENSRPKLLDVHANNAKSFLADLIINNPRLGTMKTLQIFGLKQAFNTTTPRELREMFGKQTDRNWYRLIAEAKKVNLPPTKNPFTVIREHLNRFEPLKLVDFQDQMLNNDKYAN